MKKMEGLEEVIDRDGDPRYKWQQTGTEIELQESMLENVPGSYLLF
jgi:hypothetical protein